MLGPDGQAAQAPQCPRCFSPMRRTGGLPKTTNLPGVTSYRCEPCNETAVVEDREVRR